MRFQVGQRVGDYEFLAVVDATPTGVTYRVQNLLADRQEVLKVLPPDMQDDQECVDRFLREAKIHARLHHPNIAAFYNATRVDGQLVMTSELVEGASLEQRIGSGSLSVEQAARYFEQALSALSYAHREGVVHRDIKPGHLIVTPDDTVKITGFGLAKKPTDPTLTQPGLVLGSMHYMSPEQVKGSVDVDRRSDIYSLGVVLYEAVTGKKPFDSKSQFEVFLAHVNQEPEPPSSVRAGIPSGLDHIILTAMAKQPDARFQTAEQFRDSLVNLHGVLGDGGAMEPTAAYPQPQAPVAVSEPEPAPAKTALPYEPVVKAPEPDPLDQVPQASSLDRAAWEATAELPAQPDPPDTAEAGLSEQSAPREWADAAGGSEPPAGVREPLSEPTWAGYSEPAQAGHSEPAQVRNPEWDAPLSGTELAGPAGEQARVSGESGPVAWPPSAESTSSGDWDSAAAPSEVAPDNVAAAAPFAWGSGTDWGEAKPSPADSSPAIEAEAWPPWRESSSASAADDDAWPASENAGQSKEIPLLLRPTGDAGAPSGAPGPQAHARRPDASPGSWFGEQAFAGWTSKDILAVGALTFVIVAAVFFVLLTFLNR